MSAGIKLGDLIADKYQIDSVLGVGGMSIVYLARHLQLDGLVALKFLSAACLSNAEAIARFRQEAQAAVKLKSEHVVRVFDVGMHTNGLPYMVMEYLDGVDLARLIGTSGPLTAHVAADLLIQTCDALADAHSKGIIHRDLKPSNLFCIPRRDGGLTIKVVDFGISKVTGALSSSPQTITVTGNVVGSPSYMSPEQMKTPNRVDHRTDIWSLGVVLYESLTGCLPFPASTYAEICLRVHQDPPIPPREHGAEVAAALEAVIFKCLAKDRDQRYGSAAELALALMEFAPAPTRRISEAFPRTDGRSSGRLVAPPSSSGSRETATLAHPDAVRTAQSPGIRDRRHRRWVVGASLLMVSALALAWLLLGQEDLHRDAAAARPAESVAGPTTREPEPPTSPPITPGVSGSAGQSTTDSPPNPVQPDLRPSPEPG